MPGSWSSSGSSPGPSAGPGVVDLHLEIDASGGLAEGVAAALRNAIADGRLPAGAALPSTRVLAADLGVARGTVTAAYTRLAEQGHLGVAQGAPTRVLTGAIPGPARGPRQVPAPGQPEPGDFERAARWDLRPGRPCTAMFPRADWAAATRAVLARATPSEFDYPDAAGLPALREAVARYLGRARGVVAGADRVVVCPGFGAGLGALTSVLAESGVGDVQFEDPSLVLFRTVVAERGVRISGARVDEAGLQVDAVTAPVVVATPAHQFPLGMTLPPARRAALAARKDLLVVEDDYDGEFRFAAQPVGALQALAPEHIVYGGTASKALAPAVGLGWLVLPAHLVGPVTDVLRRQRLISPALSQLVLAELLHSGRYDRHVRRARTVYRRRRAAVLAAVSELRVRPAAGSTAGLHLALLLPDDVPEERVLAAAAERGVAVAGLHWLWIDRSAARPGLVVGYAAPPEHAFAPALAALVEALRAAGCARAVG
ncbi:MAG TPA: PLP-dependent aminotransferase family protein [Sporichthya sp.]|nr:PLP-dependent aminotransferase family protein [Sporichthya sp.]